MATLFKPKEKRRLVQRKKLLLQKQLVKRWKLKTERDWSKKLERLRKQLRLAGWKSLEFKLKQKLRLN